MVKWMLMLPCTIRDRWWCWWRRSGSAGVYWPGIECRLYVDGGNGARGSRKAALQEGSNR